MFQISIGNINADDESSSLDSARSFRSKRTNLTYVIESHTDVSSRGKLDGTYDDELAELLSRESHTTFRTCYIESRHFIDEEKTSASLRQSIETCSSNVDTSDRRVECKTFRITKSCEDGRCNLWQETPSFESRTDLVERENRTTKRSLSARHFSIQYPFEAKLAKTKEENLKLRYDEK